MHATTSFKVDEENIAIVQNLTHTRELSKVINYLLREYRERNGKLPETIITELKDQLAKKEAQYEALKREIADTHT